ncbi:MAG: Bax inhibitor-1/YccA family protein [Ilumatobacteraceae bacterium]
MSNPVLNERSLQNARSTWAPPSAGSGHFPPVTDGPVSDWSPSAPTATRPMTVNGAVSATATLLVLLLVSASFGWLATGGPIQTAPGVYQYGIPTLAWVGLIVGIGLTFLLMFRPTLAKFVAPVYALAQGFFIGAISRMYETFYDGIVVQAAGATIAVFAVMLVLYRTRIIKVTERFRRIVVAATIGVMLFYGVTLLIRLFAGADAVSFLASPSLLGIGFSIFVAGLAAFNLALDFDFIERGAEQRLDKNFEWFAAFGLLVTIIWLYLELLRLLAKLRER